MNVTPDDLRELATMYLLSLHCDDSQRTVRSDEFKMRFQSIADKEPGNGHFIEQNLGEAIQQLQLKLGSFFANVAGSISFNDLKRFLDLQKALDEESSEEEKREKWLNPQTLAEKAFSSARTPINWLREVAFNHRSEWDNDERTDRKAYVFACFSEIAYLKFTKFDTHIKENRYKVVPSEALQNLPTYNMKYDLETVVRTVTGGEGVTVTMSEPGRGFIYATFRTPRFVVVAVRGTSSVSEGLLIDLDFLHDEEGYHRGFHKEARTAMPELKKLRALVEAANHQLPVYFTGHSLGAVTFGAIRIK